LRGEIDKKLKKNNKGKTIKQTKILKNKTIRTKKNIKEKQQNIHT